MTFIFANGTPLALVTSKIRRLALNNEATVINEATVMHSLRAASFRESSRSGATAASKANAVFCHIFELCDRNSRESIVAEKSHIQQCSFYDLATADLVNQQSLCSHLCLVSLRRSENLHCLDCTVTWTRCFPALKQEKGASSAADGEFRGSRIRGAGRLLGEKSDGSEAEWVRLRRWQGEPDGRDVSGQE